MGSNSIHLENYIGISTAITRQVESATATQLRYPPLSTSSPHPLAANNKHVAEIYSPAPLLQLLMTKNFHIFIIYTLLYIFILCIDVDIHI